MWKVFKIGLFTAMTCLMIWHWNVVEANAVTRTMRVTAYCNCRKCCGKWAGGKTASGTWPEQGRTIAVDKRQIPLGTTVMINGLSYTAEDTGSGIGWDCIDVYFDDHAEAKKFGVKYLKVNY